MRAELPTILTLVVVASACGERHGTDTDAGADASVDATDAGPPDSGPSNPAAVDDCGDPDIFVIATTTTGIRVDTRSLSNLWAPDCSGNAALGNEGFFALDVVEGEYWHIHLQPDPSAPGFSGRDPSLYRLEVCDVRVCDDFSDRCDGPVGEDRALVAAGTRRWFIGIDDRNPGGGQYLLDVIRPSCGANGMEHGEACDDGNTIDGDGCDHRCRSELTGASPSERLPNSTPVEANVLLMPASNELIVSGDIGGSDCLPDYFAVTVPEGASLDVTALDASELACIDATTARFNIELLNTDLTRLGGRRDINGCPLIDETGLPAAEYLIRLVGVPGEDRPELYAIQVLITP